MTCKEFTHDQWRDLFVLTNEMDMERAKFFLGIWKKDVDLIIDLDSSRRAMNDYCFELQKLSMGLVSNYLTGENLLSKNKNISPIKVEKIKWKDKKSTYFSDEHAFIDHEVNFDDL